MSAVLKTARVRLDHYVAADEALVSALFADPLAQQFFPALEAPGAAAEFIARQRRRYRQDGFGLWAMRSLADGCWLGDCGLVLQAVNGKPQIEVGYHLLAAERGQGFATEAALACRDYAFEDLAATRMISIVHVDNHASKKVAARVHTGVERNVRFKSLPVDIFFSDASA